MEQLKSIQVMEIVNKLKSYIGDNQRLEALFTEVPTTSLDVYQQTSRFYATKKYDLECKGKIIPHGFYQILVDEANRNGILAAMRKYDKEITNICETLDIEKKDIIVLLKALKKRPNEILIDSYTRNDASFKLKEYIRKFTAKYKENYIKSIMDAKMAELKGYVRNVSSGQKKYQLNPETFITMFLNDAKLCDVITNFIDEALNISPESYSLEELLYAAFADILNSGDDSVSKMAQVLNLSEPIQYQKFTLKANKKRKRLKRNYEPKLNNKLADYSLEFKKIVLCFIKINCHAKRNNQAKVIYDEDLKANMPAGILALIEEISVLLVNNDVSVSLNENGEFYFEIKPVLSAEEEKECAEYDDKKNKVRKIHDKIFKLYKKNNFSYSSFMKENQVDSSIDENSNMIDITHWLSFDKIKILIDNINVKDLNSLSNEQFECLKNFMIEQGLLWAYVSGNVEASIIIKLINNFKALFYCIDKKDFNIQNLDVIIRYALIYDYADELVIGLVGFENIAKIISYNQFIDGNLTDEMIYSRLRKVVDLAVRSEQVTKSSLPYNCDINTNDYSLVRYKNNDPDIFSCGVDTKTCFFVSVNENDFFFYSLLNKNGYVLKIVNKQNELIARASCLRKNNVLLINGIRYKK